MMTQPQAGTVAGRQMMQQLLMAHAPLRSDVAALRKGLEVLDAATTRAEDIEELLRDQKQDRPGSFSQAVTPSAMCNRSSHPQILEGRCYRGIG
ncbi:hypothetical protein [Streptomyces sp. NBC_00989]|uniref:hypothetical protein n=1 Tax=Streptomyces sp. NBC_00989 TaxID=2903705 RepID=UPI0038647CA6|nr:hypothetical protein OG714_02460 [Streptomyces sp. NBC_00989]